MNIENNPDIFKSLLSNFVTSGRPSIDSVARKTGARVEHVRSIWTKYRQGKSRHETGSDVLVGMISEHSGVYLPDLLNPTHVEWLRLVSRGVFIHIGQRHIPFHLTAEKERNMKICAALTSNVEKCGKPLYTKVSRELGLDIGLERVRQIYAKHLRSVERRLLLGKPASDAWPNSVLY